jgi:hypothetical protein
MEIVTGMTCHTHALTHLHFLRDDKNKNSEKISDKTCYDVRRFITILHWFP